MKRLLAVLVFITPLVAEAATWSWTDAAGTVHFTDNPATVPMGFRHQLRQRDDGAPSFPATVPAEPASHQTPPPAAPHAGTPSKAVEAPAVPSGQELSIRYGNRTAGEWQAAFRALRGQLAEVEGQFEQARREGGDGKTALSRQKIDDLNARNRRLNAEYEAVRLRFNRLVEEANAAGLPPEFSR